MALLDSLLGGNSQSSEQSTSVNGAAAANPSVDLHASDVLHALGGVDAGPVSAITELVGVGNLDLGAQAPVGAAVDVNHEGGGLLAGLL